MSMQRHQRPQNLVLPPNPLLHHDGIAKRVGDPSPSSHTHAGASQVAATAGGPAPLMIAHLSAKDDNDAELALPEYSNSAQPSPVVARGDDSVGIGPDHARLSSPTPSINAPTPTISEHLSTFDGSVVSPISSAAPHLRNVWSSTSMANSLSPGSGSAVSSPALAAMSDITPLPSPLIVGGSPPSWRRTQSSRPGSGGADTQLPPDQVLHSRNNSSPTRKKGYGSLTPAALEASRTQHARNIRAHSRNRSLSEYTPDPIHNVRPRHVTLAESSHGTPSPSSATLQREHYLAEARGLAVPQAPHSKASADDLSLPTPPPSIKSDKSESEETHDSGPPPVLLKVCDGATQRVRFYRQVRELGQGTFSKVVLATSDPKFCTSNNELPPEAALDPKSLVAVKVVEHGPAGGADEERVELGLHREVETLLSLAHPSLVWIRSFDLTQNPSLIVLNYCPGGDLFELATQSREPLPSQVVARIMAELVDAVRYLHGEWIAHRDIKLENVLVNQPPSSLLKASKDFLDRLPEMDSPIVTLTDLGLCKRIPQPPESPLLTTRCGSEDYAAPEILLGQPYDGRATDAWALGVLLYALMERRLPFDVPPGHKGRKGRPAHRIARCEWVWCRFGDEDGEWDSARAGPEWEGAREVVEGLLKKVSRGRASLDAVAEMKWVKDAIQVPGGLKRSPEDEGDGVAARLQRPRFQFMRRDTRMVDGGEDDEEET